MAKVALLLSGPCYLVQMKTLFYEYARYLCTGVLTALAINYDLAAPSVVLMMG